MKKSIALVVPLVLLCVIALAALLVRTARTPQHRVGIHPERPVADAHRKADSSPTENATVGTEVPTPIQKESASQTPGLGSSPQGNAKGIDPKHLLQRFTRCDVAPPGTPIVRSELYRVFELIGTDEVALVALEPIVVKYRDRFHLEFAAPPFGKLPSCRHLAQHVLPKLVQLKQDFVAEISAELGSEPGRKLETLFNNLYVFDPEYFNVARMCSDLPETGRHPADPCLNVVLFEREREFRLAKKAPTPR